MINFSLLLTLTTPKGSWILLPNMFFFFLKILQNLHYVSICLRLILYVSYVNHLPLIYSKVLLFFHGAFFFSKIFSVTTFLFFCFGNFGDLIRTAVAVSFTISFSIGSCLTLTVSAGVRSNCTKRKFSCWFWN